ncbi:siderophore-interacting protein [Microbulbifer sp. 2205BS26-8]|uniref:siderophore-interacting protein n=1 Tax=Microbulbifer sp. 2205BS26-8 TaxID=3064386 RepID=UPI00273FBE34|nr:siderophore-interacting protein [Microbulbifer sp. 2205BS26-8]MDP5208212.1 siderophore-interacting protein [Microbulbifer sp. 2205BS26-8]
MLRPAPRNLEVLGSTYITPHMLRITLGGEALAGFPKDLESAYVKLIFPNAGESRPLMRTYTIRHQRDGEIDIDFVIHDNTGPASSWALAAKPGGRIDMVGPGAKKLISQNADWFLLVGDMTALPAISVNLATLPQTARGHAVIEVVDESDIQDLPHPEGMELHWVVNPSSQTEESRILERVESLEWLEGRAAVWAACEFSEMQRLRKYFREEREIPSSLRYVSSYWKIGFSADQHKLAKQEDTECGMR